MVEEVDTALPFKSPEEIALENSTGNTSPPHEAVSEPAFAPGEGYTALGWIALFLSACFLFWALNFETSVDTDVRLVGDSLVGGDKVQNIGLLQTQMMIFHASLTLTLVAILLIATGALLKARR